MLDTLNGNGWKLFLIFSAFFAVCHFLISQEAFIYFWDYSGYWARNLVAAERMFSTPFEFLGYALKSINSSEYNYLLPALMALPTKLFGGGYLPFVMIVCVMFAFPAALLLSVSGAMFCESAGLKPLPPLFSILAITSLSCILVPCLNGYPDVGGLLCVASLLALVSGWDWSRFHWRDSNLVILLLFLILTQRRYYGFFVVGFVLGWSVQALLSLYAAWERRRQIVTGYGLTMLYIGGVSLCLLLLVFEGFLRMSLLGNYATKYQAYAGAGLWKETLRTLGFYGWGVLAIALFGLIFLSIHRSPLGRWRDVGMLLVLPIATVLAFSRVQAMGIQHQYTIAAPVILLIVLGLASLWQVSSVRVVRFCVCGLTSIFLLMNFLIPMSIIPQKSPVAPLLSRMTYVPKIRHDIPTLQALDQRLYELTERDRTTAYILASSEILNNDIFYKLYYPKHNPNQIPGHAHVDLRDGFPPPFLSAEYIVVCDPIQYHLKPETQQVIGLLAKDILSQTGIGTHYLYMEEFTLDRGVKAKLYHRETPLTEDDIRSLARRYDRLYPTQPELFRDRILSSL